MNVLDPALGGSLLRAVAVLVRWWSKSSHVLRDGREQAEIKRYRSGEWAGETSWVEEGPESASPYPLPTTFDVAHLSGAELRVLLRLGYLSFDTMTHRQQVSCRGVDHEAEAAVARLLIHRLRVAVDANQPATSPEVAAAS